jgi:glycosyltransferase involved in cell wall biosynthesis
MKVFVAGTSLLPSYGGPAFSVSRLATALTEAGAEVGLWAPDQSAGFTPLLAAQSSVRRLRGTEAEALASFGEPDILHDNGIWRAHNHRLAALAERHDIPRVVSTRGMLEPWAINHKRLKKRLAWFAYQRRDLKQARCHITTAEAEALNLQHFDLGVPIATVPNGVDLPEERPRVVSSGAERVARGGPRIALFLGRIYPIKGLPMLIEAWAHARPAGWILRIAGPDEAGHQNQLEKAVSAAGLGHVVSFAGPLEYEMKKSAFFDADLFVLPSHSESFGIVVAEALAHGLPVLTTTGAPWSILPENGCGWWVAPTVAGITEGLLQATSKDPETLRLMGAKGRSLVSAKFGWKCAANLILSTYEAVLTNEITHNPASSIGVRS